jgi:hypothetical protein
MRKRGPKPMKPRKEITFEQAVIQLGLSESILQHKLASRNIGRKRVVLRSDVDNYARLVTHRYGLASL